MSYRKKTLRNMQPVTRRYARVLNDLDGIARRLKNLREDIARLELDSAALHNRQRYEEAKTPPHDGDLFPQEGNDEL